jgi:cytidylate kinase
MDSRVDARPTDRGLIVALDGPASSGKSSVGAQAAARLGYRFCDTGLLYRAVTWLALDRGVSLDDPASLVGLAEQVQLLDDGTGRLARVAVDDVDRTAVVRGPEVDAAVSAVSRTPELRAALLARQRRLVDGGRIVMAGRDIGTVVLPDADLKIFLDASAEERARRRVLERGLDPEGAEAAEILEELRRRDRLDSTRPVAPLKAAPDAVVLHTDGNTLDQTVELVLETIRAAESAARAEGDDPAPTAGTAPRRPKLRQRRPIEPTRVATQITPFIWFGGIALRTIVRLIVRLRIEGDLAVIPRTGPLIVAANHTSSADPVLIGAFLNKALGRPLNWLGKRELVEMRLFGRLFRMAGIHPVDREAADLEAFRTAMRILEAGQALAVFPEGTRSRDGALQPVREGVGMLAIRSGATVVPVAIVDSDLMWPRGRLLPRFGRTVTMRFGAPLTIDEAALDASGDGGPDGGPKRGRRRGATEAATRVVMTRIAELLPPRQRGVYADAVNPESSS